MSSLLSISRCEFNSTRLCTHTQQIIFSPVWSLLGHIVWRINNPKFIKNIGSATLQIQPYKVLPSIKTFLSFFYFLHTFCGLAGNCMNTRTNSHFVHSLGCQIIHVFLDGFQLNLYQYYSYMYSYALPVILLSAWCKHLNVSNYLRKAITLQIDSLYILLQMICIKYFNTQSILANVSTCNENLK